MSAARIAFAIMVMASMKKLLGMLSAVGDYLVYGDDAMWVVCNNDANNTALYAVEKISIDRLGVVLSEDFSSFCLQRSSSTPRQEMSHLRHIQTVEVPSFDARSRQCR